MSEGRQLISHVIDYASSLVWELLTNASNVTTFPSTDDISVRFLFHNGTTSNISEPVAYPLFGSNQTIISWNDFVTGMNKFAISDQGSWCTACGNSTGVCAGYGSTSNSSSSSSSSGSGSSSSTSSTSSSHSGGVSKAVAGVIGAMVTLAVILGLEILLLLIGGFRIVSKRRLAGSNAAPVQSGTTGTKT